MLVNGTLRDDSFQRQTGYVQQQDLHLATSTVREALNLSVILRQPRHIPRQEKLDYVNTVIDLLEMHAFADAVVGVPGEGLNVEQRKRLTIGVELAARPQLLLFLDEPTSGLDSQTSWSIISLMKKLTQSGQAILCTIHQPSAMLFQRFDRLLLLAKGGKTVYFGDIGDDARTLLNYFARNGAPPCPEGANPAEYMLNVITGSLDSASNLNWPEIWNNSPEQKAVQDHLQELKQGISVSSAVPNGSTGSGEFAAHFSEQLLQVTKRLFQQYWRNPGYIYSKAVLTVGAVCPLAGAKHLLLTLLIFSSRHCLLDFHSLEPNLPNKAFRTSCLVSLSSLQSLCKWSRKSFQSLLRSVHCTKRVRDLPKRTAGRHSCWQIYLSSSLRTQ
jgi:ABC-type multidrug transport system ATPase subunit